MLEHPKGLNNNIKKKGLQSMKMITHQLYEERKRIEKCLSETKHLLSKEQKYSDDLQNKSKIDFYKNHIKTLEKMLILNDQINERISEENQNRYN